MTNLLHETVEQLAANGLSPDDVRWVGSRDGAYSCTWEAFTLIADREYDSGYGSNEVALDLVVVGDGWWLERAEYDGSEWWQHKEQPHVQADAKPIKHVVRGTGWGLFVESVAEAQKANKYEESGL